VLLGMLDASALGCLCGEQKVKRGRKNSGRSSQRARTCPVIGNDLPTQATPWFGAFDPDRPPAVHCSTREKVDLYGARSYSGPNGNLVGDHYSITSSARSRNASGIVRPIVLAVLRLITRSNLVGCTTGSSLGLSPLRMRPT